MSDILRPAYEVQLRRIQNMDVVAMRAKGDRSRSEFLERAGLQPPQLLRLIDCKSTCEEQQVVLVDYIYRDDDQQQYLVGGYSAISHTYGMDVYGVFDCECTSKCLAKVPRCSGKPCLQHLETDPRNRVVRDILNMCAILWEAGVEYAWHDGVCIAQHNPAEVDDAIKHMGWIYAHARETVIFLHYVGRPMAPISNSDDIDDDYDLISRWQSRVWTLQEGSVSKRRRYCVRVSILHEQLGDCRSLQEFEEKLDLWYREDSSKVAVIEEDAYWKLVLELFTVLVSLCHVASEDSKIWTWLDCVDDWLSTLTETCFQFPSVPTVLDFCSTRKSKHEGDRINSILGLSGVKDFVAPKDINLEASTMEFFRKQGQQGLARAVFTANVNLRAEADQNTGGRRHTWLPSLSSLLWMVYEAYYTDLNIDSTDEHDVIYKSSIENFIEFTVLQDGKIELTGELACVAVKFTVRSSRGSDARHDPGAHGLVVVKTRGAENPGALMAMDLRYDIDVFSSSLAQASSLELGMAVIPIVGWEQQELPPAAISVGCDGACCRAARACLCQSQHGGGNAQQLGKEIASLVSSGDFERASHSFMEESGSIAVIPHVSRTTSALAPLTAQASLLHLGLAIVPNLHTGRQPWVEGREIKDGESFCAHLVVSLPALQRHQDNTVRRSPSAIPSWDWSLPALLVQGLDTYDFTRPRTCTD